MTIAIISPKIRRDIQHHLKYFENTRFVHFYRDAASGDMDDFEFTQDVRKYRGALSLFISILRLNPDAVQGAEPYWFPRAFREGLVALIYSWLFRKRLFFPVLELRDPRSNFGKVIGTGLLVFMRILAHKASFIFVVTDRTSNLLKSNGVAPEKIVKLPWANAIGIDLDEFTPKLDGTEPSFGTSNVIVFIGNLIPIKGIKYLLEAFALIRKSVPDAKLVIVGKGPLEVQIREFASMAGFADGLVLLGQVLNRRIPSILRAARVSVLPSIELKRSAEQIGMVNIQSLACGTPVVTTDCGAIPEFVVHGENAFVVPQRDSQSLAEAIIRLLEDSDLREKMATNGRCYCQSRFDVKANVKKVESFLVDTLASTEGGGHH